MTPLWRGSSFQKARLVSGLVLFVFAATHFLNHALGLVSLDAMNAFDAWRFAVIRSGPGTVALGAALLIHVALAFEKIVRRRTLRMPAWEAAQIGMGLAIPIFLLPHIVNTRIAATFFGVQDTYAYELVHLWPSGMVGQTALLALVWVHGCMGLHYWLRLGPTYGRIAPVLLAMAVLVPFAAFAGISVQGRALQARVADPQKFGLLKTETNWLEGADAERVAHLRDDAVKGFLALLAATGLFLGGRAAFRRHGHRITLTYLGGPTIVTLPGETLLETSRRAGVPHVSVCGGRGRCSTCRVMVLSDDDSLAPASELEVATLAAIEAGPRIRLACQARPRTHATVAPLLKTDRAVSFLPAALTDAPSAVERDLAVLFVDMRGFTTLTERKLAFDVVFILNQFFATVGKPIYDVGGWITNYAGDGLIALFADEAGIAGACRSAVLAAAAIDRAVADLNKRLTREIQQPIRIAMGLHAGPHVIGRIGYRDAHSQSVIGLAVNVASRMEVLAKQAGVQMALSETAAVYAGLALDGLRVESTDVRGLERPIGVVFVEAARDLADRLQVVKVAA